MIYITLTLAIISFSLSLRCIYLHAELKHVLIAHSITLDDHHRTLVSLLEREIKKISTKEIKQ